MEERGRGLKSLSDLGGLEKQGKGVTLQFENIICCKGGQGNIDKSIKMLSTAIVCLFWMEQGQEM